MHRRQPRRTILSWTRRAGIADSEKLARVHVVSWQEAYRGVFSDAFLEGLDPVRRTAFFADKIAEGAQIIVAEADREVVGFCWPAPSGEAGWGEILAIYTRPDHWGQGHGHRLLRAGERQLRDDGFDRALLWVLESNTRARQFYERQGWRLAPRVKIEEIGGIQVTEVRYQKDLPDSS